MNEIISPNQDGLVTANSADIADRFGKEHSKVKRSIKALEKDVANFGEMFYETKIKDSYGREQDCYKQMPEKNSSSLPLRDIHIRSVWSVYWHR